MIHEETRDNGNTAKIAQDCRYKSSRKTRNVYSREWRRGKKEHPSHDSRDKEQRPDLYLPTVNMRILHVSSLLFSLIKQSDC